MNRQPVELPTVHAGRAGALRSHSVHVFLTAAYGGQTSASGYGFQSGQRKCMLYISTHPPPQHEPAPRTAYTSGALSFVGALIRGTI